MRWDDATRGGSSPPIAATRCAPASSSWRTVRCIARSCPASRASRPSRATRSTPAVGTTTTPAATPTAASTGLADKRVGIIGTGATAIQCVPHLGASGAGAVRVPAHAVVGRRARQPADRSRVGVESLEPGWQRDRDGQLHNLVSAVRRAEDLVDDGWTDIIAQPADPPMPQRRGRRDRPKDRAGSDGAGRLREDGGDPRAGRRDRRTTRRRPRRSSRTTASSASARASTTSTSTTFNRPNVTLVDTRGQGRRADHRAAGWWSNGVRSIEVDCLIYATGFEVGTDYTRRAGYEVFGRDGVTLTEKWARRSRRRCTACTARGLPELLHRRPRPVGLHRELPAHARRAEPSTSPTSSPRLATGVRRSSRPSRRRGGVGRHDRRACRR